MNIDRASVRIKNLIYFAYQHFLKDKVILLWLSLNILVILGIIVVTFMDPKEGFEV